MAGNSIGQLFRVTTCGESHGVGLMAIVDGVPPGLELTADDLQKDFGRTPYAAMSSLIAARIASDAGDGNKALDYLRNLIFYERILL